jgi:DNA polymerase III epsilon subunit-like protein
VRFLGFDLETSGSDVEKGHVPIEVGMANTEGATFSGYIYWNWGEAFKWSDQAAGVHRLTKQFLDENGLTAGEVANRAKGWLDQHFTAVSPSELHVVGWNVAGFDMPFVSRHLPKLRRRLSYRTVDLNAVLFTMVEANVERPSGGVWTYDSLKRHVKESSFEAMAHDGHFGKPHQASYDALEALYSWSELRRLLR